MGAERLTLSAPPTELPFGEPTSVVAIADMERATSFSVVILSLSRSALNTTVNYVGYYLLGFGVNDCSTLRPPPLMWLRLLGAPFPFWPLHVWGDTRQHRFRQMFSSAKLWGAVARSKRFLKIFLTPGCTWRKSIFRTFLLTLVAPYAPHAELHVKQMALTSHKY